MIYYIDTIEQVRKDDGSVNEYGKREQCKLSLPATQAKFYKKLSDVSNDMETIGGKHIFMNIRLIDSTGGTLLKKTLGTLEEVTPGEPQSGLT